MKLNVKGGTGVIVKSGNRNNYSLYLREIEKYKPLSREEEYETFVNYRETGNEALKQRLFKHNLLFVVSVARKYSVSVTSNTIQLEDLINEGNIGLLNAIDKFDHTSGFKFISYAVWHIKQQIMIAIHKNMKSIRIPSQMRNEFNQFLKEKKKLEQELGRDVVVSEIFDSLFKQNKLKLNDNVEKFERLFVVDGFEKSLNVTIEGEDKTELIELLVSDEYSPVKNIQQEDIVKILKEALNDIPKPYRSFIVCYYGLFNHEPMTYKEIADKFGLSPKTVETKIKSYVRYLSRRKKRPENVFI